MRFSEGNIKLTEAVDVGPGDLSRLLEIDTIEKDEAVPLRQSTLIEYR